MEEKYLAVDVGGTFIKYAVMDRECRFYEKGKVPTPTEDLDAFVDAVAGLYEERKGQVAGIAMSAAGMVDAKTGFMYNGGAVSCITNLNLAQVLQERCGMPVTIENDARSAALAEHAGRSVLAAVGDRALAAVPRENRDTVRADIMKQVLILQV